MGGGDLNMKKSWHPLLMKNQERVWLKEKDALAEKKKLDQLRKEKDEERQLQELQRMQEEQTGKKRQEKLDWMYATPAAGGGPSANDLEEYLLGKKRVDKILTGDENEKVGAAHKNFIAVQNANNIRDTAAKVREDPMFAIKQQEQAALQALMSNPLRLQAMKAKAGIKDKESSKKEKKKHKHRHRGEDGDDVEDVSRRRRHQSRSRSRTRSPTPPRRHDRYHRRSHSPPPRRHDGYARSPPRRRDGSRERDRSPRRDRSRSIERRSPRRERTIDSSHRGDHRRQEPYPERPRRSPVPYSRESTGQRREQAHPQTQPSSATDDRAARLAAMTQDATSMEATRNVRLANLEAAEKAEREAEEATRKKAGKGTKGSFLREQEKLVYGVGNGIGLEERLTRGRAVLVRESDA